MVLSFVQEPQTFPNFFIICRYVVRSDGAFIRQLFLQQLLSNVCMVLASASKTPSVSELAKTADKIIELAISNIPTFPPNISTVSPSSQGFDMVKLHAEITCLKSLCVSILPTAISPALLLILPQFMCWYHQKFLILCSEVPLLFGKCLSQPLMATIVSGHIPSDLFYNTDNATELHFLLYIGAKVNAIPCTFSI